MKHVRDWINKFSMLTSSVLKQLFLKNWLASTLRCVKDLIANHGVGIEVFAIYSKPAFNFFNHS